MSTFNLRRFSSPEGLKAIKKSHLLALFSPHAPFFEGRGVALPPEKSVDGLDYNALVQVLMTPDHDTPKTLANALYFIHEMATEEGMDILLEEAESRGLTLETDPTPADVAVQLWLVDHNVIERKHAEQHLRNPRSFAYYQTDADPIPAFREPDERVIKALESELDDWFEMKKRGRGARVFVYHKDGEAWFLVRHGDPFKREGSIESGESSSVFYRPEKFDVLVYDGSRGEIRMNARSKGERELYRKQLGKHLFGDEAFFPGEGKYTLDPLRTDGEAALVCTDVAGLEYVRLREVHFFWGGANREMEIRKADDVFAAFTARSRQFPAKARISCAKFQVKFADSKTPRSLTIKPSNIAQYQRDDDAAAIEDWLLKRGFIKSDRHEDEENPSAVAGA